MKPIQHKDPSLIQLVLTAVSGITLGALAACAYLLSLPVTRAAHAQDDATLSRPGDLTTYFLAGKSAPTDSPTLSSRLSRIDRRTAGPLSFTEEEINRYIESLRAESKSSGEEAPKDGAKIETINVRMAGDHMVWSLKAVINPASDPFNLVAQMDVHFVNTESGPSLEVTGLRLNSLPVPMLGGALSSVVESKLAQIAWPEQLVKKWNNIREIAIEDNVLVITVGVRGP